MRALAYISILSEWSPQSIPMNLATRPSPTSIRLLIDSDLSTCLAWMTIKWVNMHIDIILCDVIVFRFFFLATGSCSSRNILRVWAFPIHDWSFSRSNANSALLYKVVRYRWWCFHCTGCTGFYIVSLAEDGSTQRSLNELSLGQIIIVLLTSWGLLCYSCVWASVMRIISTYNEFNNNNFQLS